MNMAKKRVSQKQYISSAHAKPQGGLSVPGIFMRKALAWGAGILGIFITVSFFTGTYDTAQAKDTLLFGGGSALVLWWISSFFGILRVYAGFRTMGAVPYRMLGRV